MNPSRLIGIGVVLCFVLGILAFLIQQVLKGLYYVRFVRKNPDDAFSLFVADPQRWFIIDTSNYHDMHKPLPTAEHLPQKKLVGPFEFRVPKFQGRRILVYGTTIDCVDSLRSFIRRH